MKFLRNIILGSITFGFLVACITAPAPAPGPVVGGYTNTNTPRPVRPEPEDRTNDEIRDLRAKIERLNDQISRNAKTPVTRRKTKSECEGDRDCERICDDIYSSSRDRKDCQEMSVAVVERLKEVYEALEDGDSDELEGIDYTDLDVLLSISVDPLEDAIQDYNSREARNVAAWLSDEPDVVRIFQKEEDDYGLFTDLFEEINKDILEALSKNNITSGDSFMELIIDTNNEVALEDWVHGYLQDEKCDSASEEEFCILSQYCQMDLDDREQDDLSTIEYFEDFIEDLIEDANDGNIKVLSEDNDKLGVDKVRCPVTREYIVEEACTGGTDAQRIDVFFNTPVAAEAARTADVSCKVGQLAVDFEVKEGDTFIIKCGSIGDTWNDIDDGDIDEWGDKICK